MTRNLGKGTLAGVLLSLLAVVPSAASAVGEALGKFRNTFYYSVQESDYRDQKADTPVLDMNDRSLAQVSAAFKRAMDVEGTGKLLDGRVLNYAGRKPDGNRYLVTPYPHGLGAGDCALVPFRTVAVDPRQIPLGSLVRIEETVGMLLPDGTVHDGLWRAEDVGGSIKGDRVDLFIAEERFDVFLTRHGIRHLMALTLTLVEAPKPGSCVERLHLQ